MTGTQPIVYFDSRYSVTAYLRAIKDKCYPDNSVEVKIDVLKGFSNQPILIPYTVLICDEKNQKIISDLIEALKVKASILLKLQISNPEARAYVVIEGERTGKLDCYLHASLRQIDQVDVNGEVVFKK